MAQLIVLDASVVIAALVADDPHHHAASTALTALTDTDLVIAATTREEILVGPSGTGGAALAAARAFVDGCETVPVTAPIADQAAALKARHRGIEPPRRDRACHRPPDRCRRRVDVRPTLEEC